MRSSSLPVRREIQAAATKLAKQLGVVKFSSSNGWVNRFKKIHNISNQKICGESLSADFAEVESFR